MSESESYKGHEIRIETDDYSSNPLTDWDCFGHYACFHSDYLLGTETKTWKNPGDFMSFLKSDKPPLQVELFLYDHSGISITCGSIPGSWPDQQWDVSRIGIMYATREEILKEGWGKKNITKKVLEKAFSLMKEQLETYDDYLSGAVYGYIVEDHKGEQIESCWGYYGHDNEKSGLLESAREVIDNLVEEA